MGDGRTTHLGQTRPIDNVRNKSQFAPDCPELARDTTDERATVAFRLRQAPMPPRARGELAFIPPGDGLSSNVPGLFIRRFAKSPTRLRTTQPHRAAPPNQGPLAIK